MYLRLLVAAAFVWPLSAFSQEEETTTAEVQPKPSHFVSFNPWSSLWVDILNQNPQLFTGKEISYGWRLSQAYSLELGLFYRDINTKETEFDYWSEMSNSKEIIENDMESLGVSFLVLRNVVKHPKSTMSMGTRLAYNQTKGDHTRKYYRYGEIGGNQIFKYHQKYDNKYSAIGIVFQYEYIVDDYLSFGLRYSLNYGKQVSEENVVQSEDYPDSTPSNDKSVRFMTTFDGAHITIWF